MPRQLILFVIKTISQPYLSIWHDYDAYNLFHLNVLYAELASEVCHGRGKIPVADYKVANYIDKEDFNDVSDSGVTNRSCYSFCMCPGGQVGVPILFAYHISF